MVAVAVAVEPAFGTELEAEFAVSVKFAERLDVEVVTGIDVAKLVSSAAAAVAHTISTPQVSPTCFRRFRYCSSICIHLVRGVLSKHILQERLEQQMWTKAHLQML